ncbi:MAG TPA: TetR/AcrR family transcriptional regulator [Acidimicrobiia bacterium]|nr:TetR/AcrR family transcriptional regulator [Acidimicrobiia bacterium]
MATRSRSERGTRRRLHPDERRRELVAAAERVLRRQGPDGCRVEDVTTAAATAKGNFYRYFDTWDDLLVAVGDHLVAQYAAAVRERLDVSITDWWATLDDEIDRFISYQLELGGLHDVVFHGAIARVRAIDDPQSAPALIGAFIAAGVADGAFAAVDVVPTAYLLFQVLHGAADAIAVGADDAAVRAATHLIVRRTLERGS